MYDFLRASAAPPAAMRVLFALATLLAIIFWRMPKVRTLCAMLAHASIAIILIVIDGLLVMPVSFPRSPEDALRHPRRLFHAARARLGAGSEPVSIERDESSGLEPDKEALNAPLRLQTGPPHTTLHLFIKTGHARSRGLPLWLTALGSYSGNREVIFYRRVRALLSIDAPVALIAEERALMARWCLVLTNEAPAGTVEYARDQCLPTAQELSTAERAASASADAMGPAARQHRAARSPPKRRDAGGLATAGKIPAGGSRAAGTHGPAASQAGSAPAHLRAFVVPDRTGCSFAQARAVVCGLAALHASMWDVADREPAVDFITSSRDGQRRGYVAAPLVKLLLGRGLKKMPRLRWLWSRLMLSLRDTPATLLHGDCRPENLLFHLAARPSLEAAGDRAAGDVAATETMSGCVTAAEGWRVTFLDWEAVGINPAVNDLAYFFIVGLRAADSAAWESELLQAYQAELSAQLASRAAQRGPPPSATAPPPSYAADEMRDDFALIGCVLLVVQACFAVTDVFKGWGNNKRNLLPWMVRLCRYTLRLDVPRLALLIAPPTSEDRSAGTSEAHAEVVSVLEGMKQKATEGLARLRAEHEGVDVDAL